MTQQTDPAVHPVVKRLLQGARALRSSGDTRLPITRAVLVSVIDVANNIFSDSLQRTCFKAMCALAFHLLLRVGEFTASPHNLQFSNVRCEHDQVEIIFPHYKHSHTQSRHTLVASPDILHCPVQLLAQYLAVRGQASGPLFVSAQGKSFWLHLGWLWFKPGIPQNSIIRIVSELVEPPILHSKGFQKKGFVFSGDGHLMRTDNIFGFINPKLDYLA
jgi:hypothetical protein